MPHRIMNEHKGRHRTHKVKPANGYIGPLGVVVKPTLAPVLDQKAPVVAEVPADKLTAVKTD